MDLKAQCPMYDRVSFFLLSLTAALGLGDKPPNYWFAVIGATIYVATTGDDRIAARVLKALLSLMFGFAFTPWTMERTGYDEPFVIAIVIVFSLILIDLAKRLLGDKGVVETIIGFYFGKKK
jgi:hypothetical protein